MQVKSIAECSKGEHSAILSTSFKQPFVSKIFVLSIFKWSLKTGFTVNICWVLLVIMVACFIVCRCFLEVSIAKSMNSNPILKRQPQLKTPSLCFAKMF